MQENQKLSQNKRGKRFLTIREVVLFAMLGTIMFISKLVMDALPNIHLVGMLTMAYTVVYRGKALIPIYVFVLLTGLYAGFSPWWVPYLYAWAVLWAATMLLPRKMSKKIAQFIYPAVCCLHGLLFGVLCAPVLIFLLNYTVEQAIIMGVAFDIVHAVGNLVAGILVLPMSGLLFRLEARAKR